ncbi:TonB-dependent receptor [uncultured Marivirga sp.]|uniref:TonB-dependent receptor n=1 Tax=uncultured Marivirga sp. TaxID=1123707 RepID=UPI0030EE9192|tara:strand:+ start:32908 stop:35805 length:2898 start_codon:yes stop_codon:yes gene_type:complete
MNNKFLISILLVLLIPAISLAQKGIIRGTVTDAANGEALFGVNVVIEGTSTGAVTDFDGKFQINAEPGTYNVQASFVTYRTVTIEGVKVNAGEVNIIDNISLAEDVAQLGEVVVTAKAIRSTEAALLAVKRKSPNVLDGISSANFRKIGDSDAASAVKRVPGISVEGGKYVYIRGLGDRYTKSILNGVDIPGLDPDRNTLQMDIFPTGIIDNIMVTKSFTADLPADFTGGIVNIDTKEFPEEPTFDVSIGGSFNPTMHFNNNYLTYEGSNTDFLGFDNGTRANPADNFASEDIPLYGNVIGRPDSKDGQKFSSILRDFNPTLDAMRQNSFMDYSAGLSFGNQKALSGMTLGHSFSLNYKNNTRFYQDAEFGRYGLANDRSTNELEVRETQIGDYGTNEVLISAMGGLALKTANSKYKLNLLHLQNGESKAGEFEYRNRDQGANFDARQENLEYTQKGLTNILLAGEHYIDGRDWQVEWKVSPTRSSITDPDIRFTRIRDEGFDGQNLTIGSESGYPERIWRYLNEDNLASKADITRSYKFNGEDAKFKFGGGNTYKRRDYKIENYQIIPNGVEITLNPNVMFEEENLWPADENGFSGTRYEPQFVPNNTNKYDATINSSAAYASNEFAPIENLKAIIGLRTEYYTQSYTGLNQQGLLLENEQVLETFDLFPTANLVYSLAEKQNFRVGYSRTTARPSFKEASFAEILDPVSGRSFIGGFFPDENATGDVVWDGNLRPTYIDNFDLRWELFQERGQTFSLSGFYKKFTDPIEMVQYVQIAGFFQPRNVGTGEVVGAEAEFRKNLSFITPALENFSVNGNITVTQSKIEMAPNEFASRTNNAREGQVIENTREMAGQSPYILNLGMSYADYENGLDGGLFYNVQGPTLIFVGIGNRSDIYSEPFHNLNFNMNKTFGADEKMKLSVGISNILGDLREEFFQGYQAQEQVFTRYNPGRSVSVGFSYKFR